MLDLLSYPVSLPLHAWHLLLGLAGLAGGAGWAAAIVLLVVTLRLLLVRPALSQARSAAALRTLQPRLAALRNRHGHDRQRLLRETQQLHADAGVSPVGGCAPMLLQLPVLLGLSHLVYSLGRTPAGEGRFVFGAADVHSFETAQLAGGRLTSSLLHLSPAAAAVSIALVVIAAVASHVNARLAARRSPEPTEPLARWVQRFSLWVAPAAAAVVGPFLATAILLYWATNTVCTFAQLHYVARRVALAV